jgi:2-dehydro-3-deoxyglucarate aldolase/4-hydroxy-2-oxoheptanedioate aldolase
VAGGRPHDYGVGVSREQSTRWINDQLLVIPMIEETEAVDNLDAILTVPGIDVLFLGHFDLTNFLGIPGEFSHPRYLAAIDGIVAAANRHGKAAGMLAVDVAWGRDYLARGFRQIAYGVDHLLYQKALADGIASLREAAP